MKRDRIDFLPLFYVCDTSVTANFCIYGDFSWNAGNFMPNICKGATQGKSRGHGNASHSSPKAKEKRKIGPDLSIEPLQKHFCFFDVHLV